MEQVQLKIHSRVDQDGEFEEYESFAEASLKERGNLITLSYQELLGPGQVVDSRLTLHRDQARAVLKRTGAVRAVFVFDALLLTPCLYQTEEIDLSLDIKTQPVRLDEKDGRLTAVDLEYELFSGAMAISGHTMRFELEYAKQI